MLGNRVYLRCIYCYNKVDLVTLEECDRLARLPDSIVLRYVGGGVAGRGCDGARMRGGSAFAVSVFTAWAGLPLTAFCSSGLELNFDYLKDVIWEYLDLSRVYTKKKGGASVRPPAPYGWFS